MTANKTLNTAISVVNAAVGKNRIINGGMQIWQRGTSFTPSQGVITYCADRWFVRMGAASSTITQDSSVPSTTGSLFPYSIKVKRNSGDTTTFGNYLVQIIESVNCSDLAGQQVTISFWAKAGANYSGSGGYISCILQTGTVADEGATAWWNGFTGNANPINQGALLTTTWTKYTFTGTIGSGVKEIAAQFTYQGAGTAGADDSFYITGVQLEVGSVATPFERRLYGQELSLCHRYYQDYRYGTGRLGPPVLNVNTGDASRVPLYPGICPMRTTPSITAYATNGTTTGVFTLFSAGTNQNVTSINPDAGEVLASGYIQLSGNISNPIYCCATYSAEL